MRLSAWVVTLCALILATPGEATWAAPQIDQWIADLQGSDATARAIAADELADSGPQAAAAVGPLIASLSSPDEDFRIRVVRALTAIQSDRPATSAALAKLLADKSPAVRAHAAYGLGRIGTADEATLQQITSLLTDPSPDVRRASIGAMRRLSPKPNAMIPLVVKVLEDAEPSVVLPALHSLAEAGKDVVPALIEAMRKPKARYWSCLVLAEIGPEAAAAVPALTEALKDEDPGCRLQAAVALGEIGPAAKAAVPALIAALEEKERSVNYGAAFALGRIGDPQAAAALAKAGEIDDPFLKMVSTWASAKINPQDAAQAAAAVKVLVAGLASEQGFIRQAAARGLFELNAPPDVVRPELLAALQGADPKVVRHLVDAFALLGAKAVPRAIVALQSEHEEIRNAAVRVLGRIGPAAKEAVPELAKILAEKHSELRREAAYALAQIGPDSASAVPALLKAAGDQDRETVLAATYALGKIGQPAASAKEILGQRLKSEDALVRITAAWATVQVEPTNASAVGAAIAELKAALTNEHESIRVHAAMVLGDLGATGKAALPALEKTLSDPSRAVRSAAQEAISKLQEP